MSEIDPERPDEASRFDNPYAPPEAELSTGPQFAPTTPKGRPFSADEVLAASWEIYRARFGLVFGVVNVPIWINLLYQLAGQRMADTVDQESPMGYLAQVMFTLSGMVMQVWLTSGTTMALIKIARGDEAQVGDVFQGGPFVLRIIGASIVYTFALGLVFAAMFAPAAALYWVGSLRGAFVFALVAFLAALGVTVVSAARFYQYSYLIIDQGAGVFESLKRSFRMTAGQTLNLCGLLLIGTFIGVAGVLACGVGYFFTMSWAMLLLACIYVALVNAQPRPPGEHAELDFHV